jgi:phosphate transport system permease protein
VGTLVVVDIATAISLPFGVLAAIYLSECGTGKIPHWIRFTTNIISGVPSIIMVFLMDFLF